eukprot:765770-Hanusia_phi.AAC.2
MYPSYLASTLDDGAAQVEKVHSVLPMQSDYPLLPHPRPLAQPYPRVLTTMTPLHQYPGPAPVALP